jgi:hypothetical protein
MSNFRTNEERGAAGTSGMKPRNKQEHHGAILTLYKKTANGFFSRKGTQRKYGSLNVTLIHHCGDAIE